jgi:hypothetical protein
LSGDDGELVLGPLDRPDQPGVVMLQLLGCLEGVVELLVVVPGRILFGLLCQFPDTSFVLGNGMVDAFEASIHPDHLIVSSCQFC